MQELPTAPLEVARSRHVGITNEGATCFMNALLQSLYFTDEFRIMIDSFEPPSNDEANESSGDDDNEKPKFPLVFALQDLFTSLDTANSSVSAKKFIKAVGWASNQQEDVQEFLRDLLNKLNDELKGKMKFSSKF